MASAVVDSRSSALPAGELGDGIRRGGDNCEDVGGLSERDVVHARIGLVPQADSDRFACQGAKRGRADEAGRSLSHHDVDPTSSAHECPR